MCAWLQSRFTCVQLYVTVCTVAHQAPLSTGILQARAPEWGTMPFSRGSSQPRDQTQIPYVSCIGRQVFITGATWKARQALTLVN